MSLGAAPVKADPDCAPDQAYIKAGAERGAWAVHVKLEQVDESGDPPPPDNANTLCTGPCGGYCRRGALRDHMYARTDFPLADECVKLERSLARERAALYAELYAEHAVKDELVLGPERVQRRAPAAPAAHAESFIPREPSSAVPGKALVAGPEPARELLLKKCSVRLERLPLRSYRDTGGDSDVDHELYTTLDYEKDPICELCGTRFPLKSDLMKHVVVHIHIPTSAEDSGAADDDYEKEGVRDHLESDDLGPCWRSGEPAPASRPPRTRAGILHANNTYHCDICGRTFIRKIALTRHIKMHMAKCGSPNISKVIHKRNHAASGPYSCECKEEFTVLNDLLLHIQSRNRGCNTYSCAICKESGIDLERHTREKPFSCEICERRFSTLRSLKKHEVTLHSVGKKKFNVGNASPSCEICNNQFADPFTLKLHKRIHRGKKPYSCKICKKRFLYHRKLKDHKRIHTGEKPFSCEICKGKFTEKGYLKIHYFTIHGVGDIKFSCEICNRPFNNSSLFKKHKRAHTGEKPYPCEVCNKRFVYPHFLKKHKRIHTGERPYPCEICNKRYIDLTSLKQHKRIHTREYPCEICNKRYIDSTSLMKHKRIHTREYPCEICNKRFESSCLLKRHKRIHTGEKPYPCEICNKRFVYPHMLKIHKRIHTGERPYHCEICNKRYIHSTSLVKHKGIHTGEKPYPCEICNKGFVYPHLLKKHKRIHTGERPYPCEICNKRYIDSTSLMKHKRIHTGESSSSSCQPKDVHCWT